MAKKTKIPAGYRLTVDSWENDGDSSRSEALEGLSREEVEFYVGFIKYFHSGHDFNNSEHPTFGNMMDPSEGELEKAEVVIGGYLAKHKPIVAKIIGCDVAELENDAEEPLTDVISDLHYDLFGSSEYFHFRVLDSYKVEYVPTEVILDDVTNQFP